MKEMYKGKVNSPATQLAEAIDLQAKNIKVDDASVLPAGPNLAVIGTDGNAETIKYESINNNILVGCTRGFQGEIRVWEKDTPIARNFTEYDLDVLQENINELEKTKVKKTDLEDYVKLYYDKVPAENLPIMGNGQAGIVPAKDGKFLSIFAEELTDMPNTGPYGIAKTPFGGGRIDLNPIRQLPSGGTAGQVLKKTEAGAEWKDEQDLSGYVKKDGSKVLSTNDYTDEDKKQVGSIPDYLKKTELQDELKHKSINYTIIDEVEYSTPKGGFIAPLQVFNDFAKYVYEGIGKLDFNKLEKDNFNIYFNNHANKRGVLFKHSITDNLTSASTERPLSANQGKILNDTKVDKDKIQVLTESEYNSLSTKDASTLYFIK